jgi:hypothetical protein
VGVGGEQDSDAVPGAGGDLGGRGARGELQRQGGVAQVVRPPGEPGGSRGGAAGGYGSRATGSEGATPDAYSPRHRPPARTGALITAADKLGIPLTAITEISQNQHLSLHALTRRSFSLASCSFRSAVQPDDCHHGGVESDQAGEAEPGSQLSRALDHQGRQVGRGGTLACPGPPPVMS